jgi:hypothetical protein
MGERLAAQLQQQQQVFLESSGEQLKALAESVDRSLQAGLAAGGRASVEAMVPVAEQTLASLESQVVAMQHKVIEAQQTHLHTATAHMQDTTSQLAEQLAATGGALIRENNTTSTALVQEIDKLIASNESLVEQRAANETRWLAEQAERQEVMAARITGELAALQQQAAGVIGALRDELSNALQRDNAVLDERQRIMAELAALTDTLQEATRAQRDAVEELVTMSTQRLADTCTRFDETLSTEAQRLTRISADAAGSSAELASLGDAFGHGVELYSESNRALMASLQRIEGALDGAAQRSDEQMGYYVAQAREIIDQSMLSQREIIEELRRLGESGDLVAAGAG